MSENLNHIPTPAQDALAAEGDALRAQIEEYRVTFRAGFEAQTKDLLATLTFDLVSKPKPSAPKGEWVKALVNQEVWSTPAWKHLHELERAAYKEEEIVRRAFDATTFEDVQAAFASEMAKTIAERGWRKDEVLDLTLSIVVREAKATCWANLRFAMEENQMAPQEALEAVRQDTGDTIVQRARYGGFTSGSMTSNLVEEAKTKGLVAFLDDFKYFL